MGKQIRARFYAFALNEFRYRRVHFSKHSTQTGAERAAYAQSGQNKRSTRRSYNGAESATDDLTPQIIAGLECLEAWAKECSYTIDWDNMVLVYTGENR